MLKVKLIAHTPQPEKVVAAAAKLCYSSAGVDGLLDGLTPESSRAFVEKLASLGHESPTEHAVVHLRHRGRVALASGADYAAPHRLLQRAEPAVCEPAPVPLCHPAGDRGG